MPATPPTVAQMEGDVIELIGIHLNDAGLLLTALDEGDPTKPITPVVRRGLRKGARAVGRALANPLLIQDSDLVGMSGFAIERVLAEAELFSLEQVLAGWHRVTQKDQECLTPTPMQGGWKVEQKQALKNRVSELKGICSRRYLEPTDQIVGGGSDLREFWREGWSS